MLFEVFLTESAANDLDELLAFIARKDSPVRADQVLNKIEAALSTLAQFPERGAMPRELLELGIREYREIFYKPYRIIYRVFNSAVYILLIADGRRDMQRLLQRRLLED